MQHAAQPGLHNRLDELATDIGRLRRRLEPGSSACWLAERIAHQVEVIIGMLEPTAAQIAAMHAPGDEDAITEAIRIKDERCSRLRDKLGWRP